ncbi:MAG TPA: PIN domain-containing protein [Thermoanaerobaculia bacterium]|nr:PIN domain-containing protein [Thermoanaerobaculia bacterium]
MSAAYIDTSCLVAIALDQGRAATMARTLARFGELISSNLLEAELRSVLRREEVSADAVDLLAGISWVYPDRPLTAEMQTVLEAGYVRGADLWHLAVALFVDSDREIAFLTLDDRQGDVSRRLGFNTAPAAGSS